MSDILEWDYTEATSIGTKMKELSNAADCAAVTCDSSVVLDGVSNAESYSATFTAIVKSYKEALIADADNLAFKSATMNMGDFNLGNPDGSMNC